MRLVRLQIQTLPGVDPGFALDELAPGVNFVTGPNAIGKSSLVRALRFLVTAPGPNDPRALALSAVFESGGRWTVRRTGSQQVWERDGRNVDPPALPDRDALECYFLSMESLMAAGADDVRIVEELRRALAGGFDLRALRTGDFAPRPRTGQSEQRVLQDAQVKLRHAESRYRALKKDEDRLPELEQAMADAREAAARAARLDQAVNLAEVLAEITRLEAGLSSFPPGMGRLLGNELDLLDGLDERRRALEVDLEAARQRRDDAQKDLRETGLGSDRPDLRILNAQRGKLEKAGRRRDRLDDRRNELEVTQAQETSARHDLGGGDVPPQLTPDAVTQAEKLAHDLAARLLRRKELEVRIGEEETPPSDEEITRHVRGVDALRAWLTAATASDVVPRVALLLVVLGAVAAAGFGLFESSWGALAGGALALAGAGWALWSIRGGGDATGARHRFAETGLDPPIDWKTTDVERRVADLEHGLSRLRVALARAEAVANDRRTLERLKRELDLLHEALKRLAGEVGFDPNLTAVGLDHFVRRVEAWQKSADKRRGLEMTIARLTQEIAEAAEDVRSGLAKWGIAAENDLETLGASLQALTELCRAADKAERTLGEADREIDRLARDLNRLAEEEAGLFRKAGLERGERDELRTRLRRHEAWQAQCGLLADAERREAETRQSLAADERLIARAEQGERETLVADRDAAKEVAEELESLQEERTKIRTRLNDAGADRCLEHAIATVEEARAALADRRDEVFLADAGQYLLDVVESEHHSEHEPEVLSEARELFRCVTDYAWDIEFDEELGLAARDRRLGVQRPLDALSSGTRMQLLLAMRMAWIRRLERGREALPLFLDEALTNSDEFRFSAAAESLTRLAAEEGRQIFYLTARRHELDLWTRAVGDRPHHIDLPCIRFGEAPAAPEDFAVPVVEPLPTPDGRPSEEYAVLLGVTPVDPSSAPDALHLFHLLRDDLDLLHRLMDQWRIVTLGQLESLLVSGSAAAAIPDAGQRRVLGDRCKVARTWVTAWREGRGRPVDRIALEGSGAVSPAFLDRVEELAVSVGRDAQALLDALREGRVARFRNENIEELQGWLREGGYLDRAEQLDAAGRQRRTLLATAHQVPLEEVHREIAWLEARLATPD